MMFGYLVDKGKSVSAVNLTLIKLFGVYSIYVAPVYICGSQCEDQFQCKYIHRAMHIVVVTVTVAFIVGQLSFFIRTILFIRVLIFQFIHVMICRFGSWACIILCIVFCKLFATATSLK
jgi:hypothetical protein